jgi:hypothetical protein
MRAGDATQRRRNPLPSNIISKSVNSEITADDGAKRKRKREAVSPMTFLTIVMLGVCVIFVTSIVIMKKAHRSSMTKPVAPKQWEADSEASTIDVDDDMKQVFPDVTSDRNDNRNLASPKAGFISKVKHDNEKSKVNNSPTQLQEDETVLALLYPPGLMGGYRNQVIRLLSLVVTAIQRKISNLLLPSLLWSTQVVWDGNETWVPIPHDLIFDVEHWNLLARPKRGESSLHSFPLLVNETTSLDCWTHSYSSTSSSTNGLVEEVLKRGFLSPIANLSRSLVTREWVTNLRKLDLLPNVTSYYSNNEEKKPSDNYSLCRNPQVHGGGTGPGRLWQGYIKLQSRNESFYGAESFLQQALIPKLEWRELAQSCSSRAMERGDFEVVNQNADEKMAAKKYEYIALHARMELEMMDHACGRDMQRNLTTLFQHVEDFILTREAALGVFVAVSRSGMELSHGSWYDKYKDFADENLESLNRVVGTSDTAGRGLMEGKTVVFECGQRLMNSYYATHPNSLDYGSLLQSVINFYIATEAKAFIGVRGSSYSTDIWTTRYYQGKGATNYEYTKNGIFQLDNGGLPPMHTNCGRMKKSPTNDQNRTPRKRFRGAIHQE